MSKSILMIDTPENCTRCVLYHYPSCRCYVTSMIQNNISDDFKPDWCPLKELPKKTSFGIEACIGNKTECVKSYVDGYNACIDEILKGENDNEQET